ncbi:hypothetical protein AAG906_008913 [Vitis piasezkii]
MMFFDGSSCYDGIGTNVVFVSPQRQILPYSFFLLQMMIEMKITSLEICGDYKLVINQILALYEVRTSASLTSLKDKTIHVPLCHRWVLPSLPILQQEEVNVTLAFTIDNEDWRQPLIDYLEHGMLLDELRHQIEIRRRAPHFIYYKETLYRHSFDGVLLRCLRGEKVNQAIKEAHSGIYGTHQSRPKLHYRIKMMGYYWPTMVKDCIEYAKKCQSCQFHSNFIHQPLSHLILQLLVPLKEVKKESVVNFIQSNIIYRYEVPWYIIIVGEALWAYRTTYQTPTQATLYSLIYGIEVVLPLSVDPSLRIAIHEGLTMKIMPSYVFKS